MNSKVFVVALVSTLAACSQPAPPAPVPAATPAAATTAANPQPVAQGQEFWSFDKTATSRFRLIRATQDPGDSSALALSAAPDAQIIFSTGKPDVLAHCRSLAVKIGLSAEQPDVAQLFYLTAPGEHFGQHVAHEKVEGGKDWEIVLNSSSGFQDTFRLDPVTSTQPSRVTGISFRCMESDAS